MANCHFKQDTQHVPTAVITGLDINKGIIINNNYPSDDTMGSWAVVGARVMVTRFWSASSATVMIVPNMSAMIIEPKILPIGIGLEDEFSVWMGYIESPRPVTIDDLKEGKLLRTFTGVIENLKDTQTTEGVSMMIQARDRAKWFLDSSIWFSAREIIAAAGTSRADLILDIANKAIGATQVTAEDGTTSTDYQSILLQKGKDADGNDVDIRGKYIRKPADAQYFVSPESSSADNSVVQTNKWYMKLNDGDEVPLGAKLKSKEVIDPNPEFRIMTTRVNLGSGDSPDDKTAKEATRNAVHYLLAGNQPMEVLKGLSMQEIYPMEIFQSQYDGNFYYAPRGNDSSGLSDPERFNRRYFFKARSNDLDPNKRLIALRTEMSSIGLKTNFIVSKQAPNTQETYDDYVLHLMTQPAALRAKSYALKLHKVYDPTIKTAVDAALVAIALARVWSKEVEAALAVMIGDPSLTPGEILQIYGDINSVNAFKTWSGSNKGNAADFLEAEKKAFIGYDTQWNAKLAELMAKSKLSNEEYQDTNAKVSLPGQDASGTTEYEPGAELTQQGDTNTNGEGINELYSEDKVGKIKTGEELGFAAVPKTIYRVEAIIHKYNLGSKGYTTELALVSPF